MTNNASNKRKRAVPEPNTTVPIDMGTKTDCARSYVKRVSKAADQDEGRLKFYLKNVDRVVLEESLEDLLDGGKKTTLAKWDRKCKALKGPSIGVSTLYLDKNDKPVFAYFAARRKDSQPKILTKATQYEGRTSDDVASWRAGGMKVVEDGISRDLCHEYQIGVQKLCHDAPPKAPCKKRHPAGANTIRIPMASNGLENRGEDATVRQNPVRGARPPANTKIPPPKRHQNTNDKEAEEAEVVENDDRYGAPSSSEEACGVQYLVHAWTQRGHGHEDQLHVSKGMLKSSALAAGLKPFYTHTARISKLVGFMLRAVWPDYYDRYSKAFAAGRWKKSDPGPFLGRVIVYKLQGRIHRDDGDGGPTACFPMGSWDEENHGGELLVPQLNAKFQYSVGHVAIFFSNVLVHKVARWKITTDSRSSDVVTPGRIGNVFYFPGSALRILDGKRPGWGKDTSYGRWEGTIHENKRQRTQ